MTLPGTGLLTLASLIGLAAGPAGAAAAPEETAITVHRCTDAAGRVVLQNGSCPTGSKDVVLKLQRPIDPKPVQPTSPSATMPEAAAAPGPELAPAPAPPLIPPPAMYQCIDEDRKVSFTEHYDPNPHCVPFLIYYPDPKIIGPPTGCRWVKDDCVRLSDRAACERWKIKKKEAESAVLRAFSDTIEFRRAELERATEVVARSCP